MTDRLRKQLAFLIEIDKMKSVYRQSLVLDRSRRETDAEHSWHLAMAALLFLEYAPEAPDLTRALHMALVHDLVEIHAGDTFAYDAAGYGTKARRERESADKLFALLPAGQGKAFRAYWEEFDAMSTPDARYAAALDRLMPFIANANTQGHAWAKYGIRESQIRERMAPVREALPALWDYVEETIRDARASGYILEG